MSATSYVLGGAIVSVTALLSYLSSRTSAPATQARRHGAQLPPGPEQNPFLGNITNFPQEKWYIRFAEWEKEFGM